MTTLPKILFSSLLILSAACSGGGEDGSDGPSFVGWRGNTNGAVVLDASGDAIRFRSDTLQMFVFGATVSNVGATSAGDLIANGADIGDVAAVYSTSGSVIAALVSNRGYLLDVIDQGGSIGIRETGARPQFVSAGAGIGAGGLVPPHTAELAVFPADDSVDAELIDPEPAAGGDLPAAPVRAVRAWLLPPQDPLEPR